jgi:integrase
MAMVLQRGKRRIWYAVFRDANGKQRWERLGVLDRESAIAAAALLEQTALRKRSAQHIRRAFGDLYREFYGEGMPSATVRAYAEVWLEQKKPETANSSYLAYKKTISTFLDFLAERADRDLADLTRSDIIRFRNELAKRLGADTVNRYVKIVRMFFKSAHRDGYLLENPAEHVEAIRDRSQDSRRPFTIRELQAVLAVADSEWKSLIRFGLYTGQRLADLSLLTWENVDLERNEIRLVTKKTGKRLTVPMAVPLRQHVLSLLAGEVPNTAIHPRAFEAVQRQGRANSVSNWFVDLLAQAGLRPKQNHQGRGIGRAAKRAASELSFHSLRHTAVSLLKDAGIPQAVVQELIGHDSEQMSALYTHVGREALEKATAALPEI